MQKYQAKPVVVEAVLLTDENFDEVCAWVGEERLADGTSIDERYLGLLDEDGEEENAYCDETYIIKGIDGSFDTMFKDAFESKYEAIKS